jgi:hypothetical protein
VKGNKERKTLKDYWEITIYAINYRKQYNISTSELDFSNSWSEKEKCE